MVERQLPKLDTRVRFPSFAQHYIPLPALKYYLYVIELDKQVGKLIKFRKKTQIPAGQLLLLCGLVG